MNFDHIFRGFDFNCEKKFIFIFKTKFKPILKNKMFSKKKIFFKDYLDEFYLNKAIKYSTYFSFNLKQFIRTQSMTFSNQVFVYSIWVCTEFKYNIWGKELISRNIGFNLRKKKLELIQNSQFEVMCSSIHNLRINIYILSNR